MRTLILLLISALAHAQSDVPEKYWIDDSNFEDTISKGLQIMDTTAFTLSKENKLPIIVFDMNTKGNLT